MTSLERGQFFLRVFIEAFDTVNHGILKHKLELSEIKGKYLNGFKSYLKHRQQFLSIGKNENSIYRRITCYITQGSILGPLLFLLYINDLFSSSSKLTLIMLSDDTNLFISDSNTENLFETMNEELRKLAIWFWVEGGGGGGLSKRPINFSPAISRNVGSSPQNCVTFSFDPFAILLKDFNAIPSASPKLLNLNQDYPLKKRGFSGQILIKLRS